MVKIEFLDSSVEEIEPDIGHSYTYDAEINMFKILQDRYWVMYPREFVKSIRYIPGE